MCVSLSVITSGLVERRSIKLHLCSTQTSALQELLKLSLLFNCVTTPVSKLCACQSVLVETGSEQASQKTKTLSILIVTHEGIDN